MLKLINGKESIFDMTATKTYLANETVNNKYIIWKKGPKFLNLAPPFEIPWLRHCAMDGILRDDIMSERLKMCKFLAI